MGFPNLFRPSYFSKSQKNQIIEVCRYLHQFGFLAACDGNVSIRNDRSSNERNNVNGSKDRILITPSARPKAFIKSSELAEITLENQILSGVPSGERLMHLAVYKHCSKARAVVHAHPPIAVAWSIAHPKLQELPSRSISEVVLSVGKIPIVPYARPGTEDMASRLLPFLPENRVLILARHGAVSWGESLEEAYYGIERLEHSAKILCYAKMISGLSELPPEEIAFLQMMREAGAGKTR